MVSPSENAAPPEDRSLEIAIHLSHAKAVADLVGVITSSAIDASESRVEDLRPRTLYLAMDCILRSIEKAEELQVEQDKYMLMLGAERAPEVAHG